MCVFCEAVLVEFGMDKQFCSSFKLMNEFLKLQQVEGISSQSLYKPPYDLGKYHPTLIEEGNDIYTHIQRPHI